MNDEKLIEIVRGYPVLYDPSQSKYMDISYKLNIWNLISKEMKESVSSCKTRWYNMRDNFRKSLKKRNATRDGPSSKRLKRYKYSEQLKFLKKYFKEKDTKDTVGNFESEKEDDNEEYRYEDIVDGAKECPVSEEDEFVPSQLCPPHENSSEALRKSATKKSPNKCLAPQSSASSQLMEYGTSTLHPVDAFLSGIGVTLKSLPPYYLNLAKSEIFATVQKYELKMLTEQYEDPSADHRMVPWHYSNTSTLVSHPKMSPVDHQHE